MSETTKTYTVLSPLRHDGKAFAPDEQVDLPAAIADSLLAAGVIGEAVDSAPGSPGHDGDKGKSTDKK